MDHRFCPLLKVSAIDAALARGQGRWATGMRPGQARFIGAVFKRSAGAGLGKRLSPARCAPLWNTWQQQPAGPARHGKFSMQASATKLAANEIRRARSAFNGAPAVFRPTAAIFTVPGRRREIGAIRSSSLLPRRRRLTAEKISQWKSASSPRARQRGPIRRGANHQGRQVEHLGAGSLEPFAGHSGELDSRPWSEQWCGPVGGGRHGIAPMGSRAPSVCLGSGLLPGSRLLPDARALEAQQLEIAWRKSWPVPASMLRRVS